jgi:predicted SAM-dependent methyltransferase
LRSALLRWYEVLKPGGDITITVPNLDKAVELWLNAERFPVLTDNPLTGLLAVATGYYSFRQAHEMAAENQVAATAQRHRRAFDREMLFIALEAAGFVCLEEINEYRHECAPKFTEQVCWQLMVRGFKPLN